MSASSRPTDNPRAASAAARLTVTLDFPDAALPDATADPGQRAWLGERDHRLAGIAAQLLAQFGALLVTHHVQLTVTARCPGRRPPAVTRSVISVFLDMPRWSGRRRRGGAAATP